MQAKEGESVIITCPDCKTRFSVEREVIAAVVDPRFHCSKCDHIFSQSNYYTEKMSSLEMSSRATQHIGTINPHYDSVETIADDGLATSGAQPTWRASGDFNEGIIAVRRGADSKVGGSVSSNPLQVPRGWDSSITARAPRESDSIIDSHLSPPYPEGVNIAPLLDTPREDHSGAMNVVNPESLGISHLSIPEAARQVTEGTASSRSRLRLFGLSRKGSTSTASLESRLNSSSLPSNKATKVRVNSGSAPDSFWRAIAMPVGAFFVFLVLIAASLRFSTAFAGGFSAVTLPGAIQPSPAGLVIRSANYKRVVLDGGETIGIISGSVINRGGESVQQILIEGALFDGAGKVISSHIIPTESPMTKTKIVSMTADALRDIQSNKKIRRAPLTPGESQDFVIAFLDGEHKAARHFSTRVYAVKGVSR